MSKKYIDAEAFRILINRLRLNGIGPEHPDWHRAMYQVLDAIKQAPAADVREDRHGHWIKIQKPADRDGNVWYRCSECLAEDLQAPAKGVPFCWSCGAEMNHGYVEEKLEDEDDQ